MSPSNHRIAIAALASLLVAFIGVAAWLLWTRDAGTNRSGTVVAGGSIGGPFTLTDHAGRRVSDGDFRGQFLLILFGFTFCPDVCPTELGIIAASLDELGPAAARVTPVLISLDPERDTQSVLAEYVPLFHERLVGLTGTVEEIAVVAKAYGVFYQKVTVDGAADYLVEHTSFVYLMGPDGGFLDVFAHGTPPAEIADTMRKHLAAG